MGLSEIYYLDRDRQRQGPVKAEELAACGVGLDSLVWMAGMKTWVQARDVPELLPYLSGAAVPAGGREAAGVPGPVFRENGGASGYGGYDARTEYSAGPARQGNVPGAVGFVLALFLIVCWIPGFSFFACWLLALIFSIVGMCRRPRGLAIAGLVITVLLFLIGVVALAVGASFIGSMMDL